MFNYIHVINETLCKTLENQAVTTSHIYKVTLSNYLQLWNIFITFSNIYNTCIQACSGLIYCKIKQKDLTISLQDYIIGKRTHYHVLNSPPAPSPVRKKIEIRVNIPHWHNTRRAFRSLLIYLPLQRELFSPRRLLLHLWSFLLFQVGCFRFLLVCRRTSKHKHIDIKWYSGY